MLVKNTQPRFIHLGEHVTLWPGVNDVDKAQWDLAMKIAIANHFVEEGILVVESKNLEDLSPKEAVRLVEGTFNPKLLEEWNNTENRKLVAVAIKKQMDKMKSVPDTNADATQRPRAQVPAFDPQMIASQASKGL